MEQKSFIVDYIEYKLSPKVLKAVKNLNIGKTVNENRFTANELNLIGLCYEYGLVLRESRADAIKWFEKAAQKRHSGAEWNKKTMEGCVFRLRGMTRQDLLRLFNTNAYRLVIS